MTYQPFKKKVYLASPTMHGDELKYMADAIEKNWVSTVGENIDEVERQVAEKVGVKYAVCLASGTAALHLAVKCAGLKKGEKVFCADMTFAATVNPVTYEGGEQVFIDTEYETWNTSSEALEKAFYAISEKLYKQQGGDAGAAGGQQQGQRQKQRHGLLL